ncbi:MAG: flagellar biosynthetic protein FliQ [Victivallales bacterium]|jgi:flagellar biosynthetic protein FliQ|nr:flagellar biosynthetic protein FliQ [Victivallales bacterium]
MSEELIIEIMQLTLITVMKLSAPIIITILVIGIVSQVIQAVTQLKDQSFSFVPKVFITGIVFTLAIPWYIQNAQQYTETIFQLITRATQ